MAAPRIKGGIGADGPYWDGLAEGRLRLSRCAGCSRWLWPAYYRCGGCGSWDIAWEDVASHGNLYTWTRNHMVSDVLQERRGDLPCVTLLVDLTQAGSVRLAGVLCGAQQGLKIGTKMSGVFLPAAANSRGFATIGWTLDAQAAV